MVAATTQNAADDGSPGTANSNGEGAPAVTRTARSSTRVTGAPRAASMRSVWSRLGAGSTTSVVPPACSPASTSAVFTCALATAEVVHAPDEVAAAHDERRQGAAGATVDVRTHRPQRLDDPRHRALHQRLVAGEDREERSAGEQAGEQPDGRARVAAVDDAVGLGERVDAAAVDDDRAPSIVAESRPRAAASARAGAADVLPAAPGR